MSKRETVVVRARRRYQVQLARVVASPEPATQRRPLAVVPPGPAREPFGRPMLRLYDGGSRVTTRPRSASGDPNDRVNRFEALHFETRPFPSVAEGDTMRRDLEAQAERPSPPLTYEHSGRPLYGQVAPLGATDETDGVLMSCAFERRETRPGDPRARQSFGINSLASWTHRMRSPAEQLAAYDATESLFIGTDSYATWRADRARIVRLALEGFDTPTLARAQADLAVVPKLLPGSWCPSFTGGLIYHTFDPLDRVNFHATTVDSPNGAEAIPWMPCGDRTSSTAHVFAQPKRPRIMFRWTAVYLNIVLFAPPILSIETNIGAFADRLPLGFAYREEPEQTINDQAMSAWIRETNRYAVALRQDLGSQVISRFYIKLLIQRVDGLWQYFRAGANVGDMAGLLDVERGNQSTRYRVFRRTAIAPGTTAEGYGSLGTQEVIPHNKVAPIFEGGPSYGPF